MHSSAWCIKQHQVILGFFFTREFQAELRYNFGKDQGLAREWEKEKGNAWIWWRKRRKNSTPKFRALHGGNNDRKIGPPLGQTHAAAVSLFLQPQTSS
jgi:hypothetical protein